MQYNIILDRHNNTESIIWKIRTTILNLKFSLIHVVSFTLEHYFLCFKYVDMSFVSGCFLFVLCLWVFFKSLFCTYFFYPVAFICVITVTLCVHSLPCLSHQG